MATQLETPVVRTTTLDYEEFTFSVDLNGPRVFSTRWLGQMIGEQFVGLEQEVVVIAGADYDTLANSGSAPGRFWPEDVAAMHREIKAR